jgi:putrescine aminotransferase
MTLAGRHTTAEWQALDRQHYLHPFTDTRALHEFGARIITRADGVWLWDSEGEKILDGMAGLWCVNIGYGRRELVDAAAAQMRDLPYYNSFFKTANPPALALASLLAEITPPQFQHVFFTNSGSEANDTIVRMVRRYWDVLGQPQRKTIISRWSGYHGSTMAGASLGGMPAMHAQGDLPIPGIVHIDPPYWYGQGSTDRSTDTPEAFGLRAAGWLEQKILEIGAENVAAFIGEPIQGAGGVIVPPSTYWPEVQRICRRHGVLLISDEVICGFGRTGRWFGCETFGFEPDLMTLAKGISSGYLPLGGVMVGKRVAEVLFGSGEFNHGYTYSGHPTCCAVAEVNVRLLREIIPRVATETGPYFHSRLAALLDHPLVGEVRGIGLIAGIELVKHKATHERFAPLGDVGTVCRDFCFKEGLIMRAVGDTLITAPPLIISPLEIDELVRRARRCLDLTAATLNIPI